METVSDAERDGGASQEFESVFIKEEDVEVTISEAEVSYWCFSDHFAVIMNILVYSPSFCSKYVEEKGFSLNKT
jgi:hypothetical protein